MASTETHLKVVNYTKNSMYITISSVENSDWDGDSRPDHNFNDVTINAFSSRIQREETNNAASSSMFNMHLTFSNGDQITLRIDQQDGKSNCQKLFSTDHISGANDDDYVVFQNNDNSDNGDDDYGEENLNRFIITSTNWLRDIDENKYIHQITIPGTHDSGTYTTDFNYTQCQTLSITKQLEFGIRFLDIRCAEENNVFQIHHGIDHLDLEFGADIRDKCISFLQNNPTEFIIMSIKQEQDPVDSTESFEDVLKGYISGYEQYFYTGRAFPAIKDVKGKIILFSRYSHNTIGIDATPWKDNDIFTIDGKNIRIQDNYKVNDIDDKWNNVHDMLKDAKDNNPGYLYLNFCSGTADFPSSVYRPQDVANTILGQLLPYIARKKATRYGIIPMDYPSDYHDAVVRATIGSNFTDQ